MFISTVVHPGKDELLLCEKGVSIWISSDLSEDTCDPVITVYRSGRYCKKHLKTHPFSCSRKKYRSVLYLDLETHRSSSCFQCRCVGLILMRPKKEIWYIDLYTSQFVLCRSGIEVARLPKILSISGRNQRDCSSCSQRLLGQQKKGQVKTKARARQSSMSTSVLKN